jgi:hypothetical protein
MTDRIREVLREALAPKAPLPTQGQERIREMILDRRVDELLAALDAAGLEIVEKKP